MDGGLMPFVVARLKSEWRLTPDRVAVLSSAGLAGMFFGGAVAGSLSSGAVSCRSSASGPGA